MWSRAEQTPKPSLSPWKGWTADRFRCSRRSLEGDRFADACLESVQARSQGTSHLFRVGIVALHVEKQLPGVVVYERADIEQRFVVGRADLLFSKIQARQRSAEQVDQCLRMGHLAVVLVGGTLDDLKFEKLENRTHRLALLGRGSQPAEHDFPALEPEASYRVPTNQGRGADQGLLAPERCLHHLGWVELYRADVHHHGVG